MGEEAQELRPGHCVPIWILARAPRGHSVDLQVSLEHVLQMYRALERTQTQSWELVCVLAFLLTE